MRLERQEARRRAATPLAALSGLHDGFGRRDHDDDCGGGGGSSSSSGRDGLRRLELPHVWLKKPQRPRYPLICSTRLSPGSGHVL